MSNTFNYIFLTIIYSSIYPYFTIFKPRNLKISASFPAKISNLITSIKIKQASLPQYRNFNVFHSIKIN